MIKSTINQIYNSGNKFQGNTKKVLTVCSAGLLRSATLQNFLIKEYDYNVRNCGTVESYALIPISEVLITWADEIVFVDNETFKMVRSDIEELNMLDKCYVLNIPDIYSFNDPELIKICKEQYTNKTPLLIKPTEQKIVNKTAEKDNIKYHIHAFKTVVEFAEKKLSEKFPNGITSYLETYYEVINRFTLSWDKDSCNYNSSKLQDILNSVGSNGIYELAISLTDKFELLNRDRVWDGEFYEEINKFLDEELY